MAPITLQPDNSETGWVIAGTVEFQGVSQYVITPVDNPAHRRPVKKQHILDWVSPKAHEDFEYAQYKRQTDGEWERDSDILAEAAAIKESRHRMGVARERAKTRKPFVRYMQLEQVEDSDRGNTTGHLSSPEHSPDDLDREVLPGRVDSIKRKRFPQDKEPLVKRRGLSSSSKPSSAWKPWKPPQVKPSQQLRGEATEDEIDVEDEVEAIPKSVSAELKRLATFDRPILPPQKRLSTPSRASKPQKSSVSLHYAPANFTPATAPPAPISPKQHWSVLGPPIRVSVNNPKVASPPDRSKAKSPTKVSPVHLPNRDTYYPPILPPTQLLRPPASIPKSPATQVAINGTGESSKHRGPKRKHHSLSPTEESSDSGSRSNSAKQRPSYGKKFMDRSHFSDLASSRSRQASDEHKSPKLRKSKSSGSSSSGSSNILRWPSNRKSPKVSNEQSKYFASMPMKQKGKEDTEDGDEGESEETWDIHGILDDEMLRVNGQLVRHYLCDWVGDYDRTWEPEKNVPADAIKRYEEKKKRSSLGFDGAADIDMISENGETLNPKTLRRLDDFIGQENEASDSEAFTDALTDTAMFLTPDENPRSGDGNAAGEGRERMGFGAELLPHM
jgi:hypothetical protein